jgi:hypothetical protein
MKATSKQIAKYKTMLNKLFDVWVSIGYMDGIEALDGILKANAGKNPKRSTKSYMHEEIEGLICETDNIMLEFGLRYKKYDDIKIYE